MATAPPHRHRRLRIVVVLGSLGIGGVERRLVRLAGELAERGHEVRVLAVMAGGPLEDELRAFGLPLRVVGLETLIARSPRGRPDPVGTIGNLRVCADLAREFRLSRTDVVYAALLWPSAISLVAAAVAGVPVRVSARVNMGTDVAGRRYPMVERLVSRVSHHIVAVSEAVAEVLVRQGAPRRKVQVIHNGVEWRRAAGRVAAQPARAIVVANLIHYKGHRDLIAALARLGRPPAVDCLGEGPERPALAQLLERMELTEIVQLRGQVRDPEPYLDLAQFSILPSLEEGLPMALLEAMAAAVPVVATAVGGVPEVVRDGETGLLVPPGEPAALARAIEELAADPDLRLRLGRAGQAEVRRRFSWESFVDRHELLFTSSAFGEVPEPRGGR